MSKNSLGKGLGELMNGDPVAGKPRVVTANTLTSTATTSTHDATYGRGLTTLVSAQRGSADGKEAPRKKQLLPAWFFFTADVLLLGYVIGITFDAPRPYDFGTVLFCAVSIGLGCVLALIGVARGVE